jgi:hypothetical protein
VNRDAGLGFHSSALRFFGSLALQRDMDTMKREITLMIIKVFYPKTEFGVYFILSVRQNDGPERRDQLDETISVKKVWS